MGLLSSKAGTMIRKMIYGLLIGTMVLPSCKKSEQAAPNRSECFVKYSGERESIIIEDVNADWKDGAVMMIAEGFDHEQLKLYLPNITTTGDVHYISEEHISFSDGLDFESTKMLDGVLTITDMDEQEVCGKFVISLLDDVGGVESRGIEGSFRVYKR